MKNNKFIVELTVIFSSIMIIISSCDKNEDYKTGFVTFGANDRGAQAVEIITIFVDNFNYGTLKGFSDSISNCGEATNITKELSIGAHTYKAEIEYSSGNTSPLIVIGGEFTISENECKKIFLNRLVN